MFFPWFFSGSDSTEITLRCHMWGKCILEPDPHYQGGELRVFDHVEVDLISVFDIDRMVEKADAYGDKKYYVLIEEHGFRQLKRDREIHDHFVEFFEHGKVIVVVSFIAVD